MERLARREDPSLDGDGMSTDEWCTPEWLADAVGSFDLDPCSNASSHVRAELRCSLSFDTPYNDGLTFAWDSFSIWCNPPYSNVLPWARKLAAHPAPWVALVKLDPSTRWWAALMEACPTVAPFRKRLKFEGAQSMTANFPSVLVYSAWRPPAALRPHLWLPTYAAAGVTQ